MNNATNTTATATATATMSITAPSHLITLAYSVANSAYAAAQATCKRFARGVSVVVVLVDASTPPCFYVGKGRMNDAGDTFTWTAPVIRHETLPREFGGRASIAKIVNGPCDYNDPFGSMKGADTYNYIEPLDIIRSTLDYTYRVVLIPDEAPEDSHAA